MHRVTSSAGITVSDDKRGSGPTLVLVHGAFSDHVTNWEFVLPLLENQFTIFAIARRGRGETDATMGHSLLWLQNWSANWCSTSRRGPARHTKA